MSTITKEFTKEQLIEQAKKNIEVLRNAVEKIPGSSDAAVIHLKLAEIALASLEAEAVAVSMKDHQIRELVNELRDIAVEHHGTHQLRERIARTVRAAMHQGADYELQRKAAIHDTLCEKYNVESLADFVEWQRNHIAELEAAPPAPVGEGETAVMPDYPGYVMTQRECFEAGWKAHHVAMLQSGAPVQFGWSKGHFGYQTLFNAIGKAVNIQGGALSISVSAFENAMLAAAPQQEDL